MSKSPEEDGFLHDHGKELVVGGLAVAGIMFAVTQLAHKRLHEQAKNILPDDEPNDNS